MPRQQLEEVLERFIRGHSSLHGVVSYMTMRDPASCEQCQKHLWLETIANLLLDFLSSLPHPSLRISLYSLGGLTSFIYIYSAVDLFFSLLCDCVPVLAQMGSETASSFYGRGCLCF